MIGATPSPHSLPILGEIPMQRLLAATLVLAIPASAAIARFGPGRVASPATAAAPAQDPKAEETPRQRLERKVEKLLELNGVKAVQERSVEQMLEQLRKAGLSPAYLDAFQERFDLDEVMKINVRVYADNLEEETVDGLITFFGSEVGKTFATAFPKITEESLAAGMEYGQRVGQEAAESLGK